MQDADGAGEAEFLRAARHGQGVFGIFHAAAEHGIDIHLENGVIGQKF